MVILRKLEIIVLTDQQTDGYGQWSGLIVAPFYSFEVRSPKNCLQVELAH